MAIKKYLGVFIILVILSASIYIMLPDKVKISVEKTRTKYFVWENESWILSATEYVNLFDGTTKMRAKNRNLSTITEMEITRIIRTSHWKDNITTIQTYTFDSSLEDIKSFPIKNEFECINCKGKIVHYEIRDILYEGETREITSPFSFGHKMKIEWQDGNYYSKVFQQKVASDKIIIKYRPESNYEFYKVRLFDPPATPGIYIDDNSTNQIVEQGTNITIYAKANATGVTTCLSADHGELGENFTCGVDNVTFTWLAESNIRKFNDSSLFKVVNFTSAGSLNVTLFEIRNDSLIENAYLDIAGISGENYTENLKIDLGADNNIDWVFWGELEEEQTKATKFNNSLTTQTTIFEGRGASSNYLKLPKNLNVSSATFNVTGGTNDNYTYDYSFGIWKDVETSLFIYAPVAAHQDGTDEFYLFGYCPNTIADCDGADNNMTLKYDIDGGIGAAVFMEQVPWENFHGGAIYNPGDDLIYVFGGYDGTSDATASNNMYTYDPDLDSWVAQTDMPGQRWGMEYVLMDTDDKIYICGGFDQTGVYNKTCFSYDIGDNTYNNSLSDMPDGLELGWGEQLNSTHLIIWGGTRRGSAVTGGRTYIYEISSDTWTAKTNMPSSYHGVSGSYIDGNVYSYGGMVSSDAKNVLFRYNHTSGGWDQLADMLRPSGQDNDMYFDECDEVDNHVFCMGSGGFGVSQNTHEFFWLPHSISITVADETTVSQTISGDLTSTAVAVSDISTEINNQLITCTADSENYCHMPLIFSNFGSGTITTQSLNITTPLTRINLGAYNVSCGTDTCEVPIEITSDSDGLLNITNMSIGFLGTSNISFWRNDTDGNSSSIIANIFYSNYEFSLPTNIDFLEFIPSKPTSTNVTPFGQTPLRPILNITTKNTGGSNMSWSFLTNNTAILTCVNLTISNTINKTDGFLQNGSWFEYANNVEPEHNFGLWMWADYGCNFTTWKLWEPGFFFRGCAEGSICSEEIT